MKLFADENVDRAIIEWLRDTCHDVEWAAEMAKQASDDVLLARAEQERRVLLTNDLDFGELVFREGLNSHGIILLRLSRQSQLRRLNILRSMWDVIVRKAPGHFVVVTPGRIRVRPLRS